MLSKHFFLAVILMLPVCQSLASGKEFSVPPHELPSLIVAYNFCTAYYPQFKGLWEPTDQQPIIIKRLSSEFNRLKTLDIEKRLLFTHMAFIVQNDITNHLSGFPSSEIIGKDMTVPFESMLFVTTPIESINNRILVILSSVSPQRTTIMTVDSNLTIALLYDSYDADNRTRICSVSCVRVIEPGILVIAERNNSRCSPKEERRYFTLDLLSGVLKLTERTGP